jgi:hypothetical protein
MKSRIPIFLSAALVLLSVSALADIVILHSGAKIEGVVRVAGDKVIVEGVHGSTAVPAGSVKQIVRTRTPLEQYREIAAQADAATMRDQMRLADWCRDNNLTDYEKYHLARALALEPENLHIRARLGYVEHRGRWLTKSEEMFERGFVKFKGKWLTPQEYEQTLLEEKAQAQQTARAKAAEKEKRKEERKKRYVEYLQQERERLVREQASQDYFGVPYTSPVDSYYRYYPRGYWWYRDHILLGPIPYYPWFYWFPARHRGRTTRTGDSGRGGWIIRVTR